MMRVAQLLVAGALVVALAGCDGRSLPDVDLAAGASATAPGRTLSPKSRLGEAKVYSTVLSGGLPPPQTSRQKSQIHFDVLLEIYFHVTNFILSLK